MIDTSSSANANDTTSPEEEYVIHIPLKHYKDEYWIIDPEAMNNHKIRQTIKRLLEG